MALTRPSKLMKNDISGSLTTSGSWFKAVKAVKDAHPKPE